VPSARILLDSGGDNADLTAKNTVELMTEHKWHSVMVISQYFYIPSTTMTLRRLGVESIYSAHPNFFELLDLYSTAKEVVGYPTYLFRYSGASNTLSS
jgi:uncharacterized SAM-binding protein YcdF (DUF218 family)